MGLYLQIAIKLAVGFVCLLGFMNLSGRAQLAPHSAVDQIGNYVLGGIIGGVLYNPLVSVWEMVAVIAIWAALLITTRLLRFRSRKARRIIDGDSLKLYDRGRILSENLALSRLTLRDFIAALHQRGYRRLDELQTVWLETNGQYTVLKKGERGYADALVENGRVIEENLAQAGVTAQWLTEELQRIGYPRMEDVYYAEAYDDEQQGKVLRAYSR